MPAKAAGTVTINEVAVHGWDIAAATGRGYACERQPLRTACEFVQQAVADNPHGSPGLFGRPVSVPDNAPQLDRLIGLTGHDPGDVDGVR